MKFADVIRSVFRREGWTFVFGLFSGAALLTAVGLIVLPSGSEVFTLAITIPVLVIIIQRRLNR
jgi:hypothetical protein